MAKRTLIGCELCILNLLILNVIAHVIETVPLCGTMDGSPLKDSDRIYFKDRNLGIRTVEINGKIYACYPDGTMVDTSSSKSSESNETIDDTTLNSRIKSDEEPNRSHPVKQVPTEKSYSPNVRQCADNNQTFCTVDSTYPADHVEKLLRKHMHKFADVFGSDSIVVSDLRTRIDGYDEVELCDSYEKVIYPLSGKTQDGAQLYILNTETHKQGVRVSICQNRGQQCRMSDSFPNNYRTECKQHSVNRELLSLSPDGILIKEKFPFPACCSCAVYRM